MNTLLATALLALAPLAFAGTATPPVQADWLQAHPNVQVVVTPGAATGTYSVEAIVMDLRSGKVLAEPRLTVQAGEPARAQVGAIGDDGLMSVTFTVTVNEDGRSAAYTSEIRDNNEVISSHSAMLAVGG